MTSSYIGLVVGLRTRTVWHLVNPDDDAKLDDPRYLLMRLPKFEPVRMLRIPRESWEASVRTGAEVRHMVDLALRQEETPNG